MNRKFYVIGLVACLALVLSACAPVSPPAAISQPAAPAPTATSEPAAPAPTATLESAAAVPQPAATPSVEEKIRNAMSAAPMAVAKDATIMDFPPSGQTEPVLLRKGTNNWTCYPDWLATSGNDPECNDPMFEAWFRALLAGEPTPKVTAPGIGYMLQGGVDASETDPFAAQPAPGEDWIVSPAHVMLILPDGFDAKQFPPDPKSGRPYIMWDGTPYEHLMVPVALTEFQEADAKIRSAMSAAPLAISKDATILDWRAEAGGEMTELRKGTNGWTCLPDWQATPGNDPECLDETAMAWLNALMAGTEPATTRPGLAYLLQGCSAASATDPSAAEPPPGKDWVVDPPTLIFLVPGGFDLADFPTPPEQGQLGQPWIMFEGTPYEHLMVPVADASPSAGLSQADQELAAKIDTMMGKENELGLFSGVALVARDGQILLSKGYGLADREKSIPNTPQTIFRVGEMTMQFTAAATLLLEQEGKLSMQDPICDYLDDCPAAWKPITIGNLVSHTSGIPDYLDPPSVEAYKMTKEGGTPQQIAALLRDKPLAYEPGTKRVWSRSGFVLAGLIIERVSGQPYGDFVKQRIFEPLGMAHSGYGNPSEGLALGYDSAYDKKPATFDVSALYASGGCYSTAEDLLRWSEGLHNGRLLNEAQLQKMLTSHATLQSGEGSGYGIVLWELAGHRAAGNAGGFSGYDAALYRYLDDRITTLLLANQTGDTLGLNDLIGRVAFGAQ